MTVTLVNPDARMKLNNRLDALFLKQSRAKRGGVPRGQTADLQGRVFSAKLGIDYRYSSTDTPMPYHIASIGKMFTAVLIGQLIESGQLRLQDRAAKYVPAGTMNGLFVHKGRDYANEVTVEQLLGHTSGVADYFGDKVLTGVPLQKMIIQQQDRHWTPQELLAISREQQQAVAPPGAAFHYSDTGYVLLGLLIEHVTGGTFENRVHESILNPLGMNDTYMPHRTKPANMFSPPMAPVWLGGTEISSYVSLSCDWSGGGIVSTTDDLLLFNRALREGKLLQPATLQAMDTIRHRFRPGLHYGLGMMEVRFEQFFFLLRGLPRYRGHIGVLSTHLFWEPETDTHIALNFGSDGAMVQSFKALIQIASEIKKAASSG
ncbi:serine hydrolase domain-containing protein [Paenibacillus soyae]|uniref:Beta-lactamase family protein n=1 Tax=Paenibacillus soyae TaxID=2969249 RepID=A0A9X2MUL4_9BACL|nr:serine hydrolase domain-containing protein [Paenibacillus soyae]MCR2806597.1 beta-lactamase family protein [Paenibacillus soyae]